METHKPFEHRPAAHCETGVISSLARHYGLDLSEAMVFGLSGAISFVFLPFVKLYGIPMISYRMMPGHIIRGSKKNLGIEFWMKNYKDQNQASQELDEMIRSGKILGVLSCIYFLPYFPDEVRIHFNGHNLIVYGRENGEYLISDPVFDLPVRIPPNDLQKARFAKGKFAPRGFVYYPASMPREIDYEKLTRRALKKTIRMMLHAPVPIIGIKGMHFLARRIEKLASSGDLKYNKLFLLNIVRMQEEIGTGGGGFRFLYAAFLQEAFQKLGWSNFRDASERMTQAGDHFRAFASSCARAVKNKNDEKEEIDYSYLAGLLRRCADTEKDVYQMIKAYS